MSIPNFSNKTVETLARRARFQCSNPDCSVQTVGPNSDPDKATTIGEAAHIFGAKPGSPRFDQNMSDVTRAAITNGIWLCCNCHREIDRDAKLYTAELLLRWRSLHEERVLKELGTKGEIAKAKIESEKIAFLNPYPATVKRIAMDKPAGWEWRLT